MNNKDSIYSGLEQARITAYTLARAMHHVRNLELQAREQLIDEINRKQPNMLASVMALSSFGVPSPDVEMALTILMVSYTAMTYSGEQWPLLTVDEQERQLKRYRAMLFTSGCSPEQTSRVTSLYIKQHQEPVLLAYVTAEINSWLARKPLSEGDRYVILCTGNLVNCIAALAHAESNA